jgi:hypothetical protein
MPFGPFDCCTRKLHVVKSLSEKSPNPAIYSENTFRSDPHDLVMNAFKTIHRDGANEYQREKRWRYEARQATVLSIESTYSVQMKAIEGWRMSDLSHPIPI